MAQTDDLLTVEQAAAYLGVSTSWLYALRGQGRGPVSWREGHRLVYPRVELDAYRARRRQSTLRGEGV
jgi:predicted DNA-binding transcriptional regulator AlpA